MLREFLCAAAEPDLVVVAANAFGWLQAPLQTSENPHCEKLILSNWHSISFQFATNSAAVIKISYSANATH